MAFINDGYQTLVTFSLTPITLVVKEKAVTPPGMDGGDMVDITTMRNDVWRTRNPRYLVTLTEFTFTASYDPLIYPTLLDVLNINQEITLMFPDTSTLAFWGWLQKVIPGENVEGTQPIITCTITPSNHNGLGAGSVGMVEVTPIYTPPV